MRHPDGLSLKRGGGSIVEHRVKSQGEVLCVCNYVGGGMAVASEMTPRMKHEEEEMRILQKKWENDGFFFMK